MNLDFATETKSSKIRSYVIYILIPMYTTKEQMMLYNAGILDLLVEEIMSGQSYLQLPALRCVASMCYANKDISFAVCNTQ